MEFKKNTVVTLDITDMGQNGEGIGKVEGYTLFVKDAVIGDRVQVKVMKAKMPGFWRSFPPPRTGWSPGAPVPVSAAAARYRRFPTKAS